MKLSKLQKLCILLVGVKDKPVPTLTHLKAMLYVLKKTLGEKLETLENGNDK